MDNESLVVSVSKNGYIVRYRDNDIDLDSSVFNTLGDLFRHLRIELKTPEVVKIIEPVKDNCNICNDTGYEPIMIKDEANLTYCSCRSGCIQKLKDEGKK